jgi:hypothetical protein
MTGPIFMTKREIDSFSRVLTGRKGEREYAQRE